MQKLQEQPSRTSEDFLPLNGTDYVEFYVGNARQAAYYYRAAFGMQLVAYRGPETGTRDRASYVVQQDKIRFVLTTPLQPDDPIAEQSGSTAMACVTSPCGWTTPKSAYRETTARGAKSVRAPEALRDEHGEVRISAIATYGDTIHSFIERRNYRGVFLPGFRRVERTDAVARPVGLEVHRPHGRQRRLGRDEPLGGVSIATSWDSACTSTSTTRTSARNIPR